MKYKTPSAFRAALEQRLRDTSKRTGLPISRLRKAVVFESLLARLIRTAKGRWVLKGAVALEFRTGTRARQRISTSATIGPIQMPLPCFGQPPSGRSATASSLP